MVIFNKQMETANLVYHFSVVAISLVIFCMKIKAPNAIFQFLLQVVGKLVPIYCILYAGVQIFKHFGII